MSKGFGIADRAVGAEGAPAVRVVVVGAGPTAAMLLERLLANHAREAPGLRLDVRLVDPHEPGGGRIWRRTQSPLLKLNSMFEDVAFFTDPSCAIEGPVAPGPTLWEWVERVRAGGIALPDWADDALRAEIAGAHPQGFPTRRLNSAYLDWAFAEVLRRAAPTARATWVRGTVVAVLPGDGDAAGAAAHRVRLDTGAELPADFVVHAVGHNGSIPTDDSVRLAAFADRHAARGARYVAPGFTADIDLDWVPAGEPAIVRGMGLAAVDLVVLLAEGRGGRFVRGADGALAYRPSGREPILHLGSRRGVPYRSKITSAVRGEPVRLEHLGEGFRDWVAALDRPLDFDADVWPRIAADMLTGYYRELGTGYPDRIVGGWADFADALRAVLAEPGGYRSPALLDLIAARVPDPLDRFDLDSFDRPLGADPGPRSDPESGAGAAAAAGPDAVHDRVRAHIARDLLLRTSPERSAVQALFLTLLHAHMAVAEVPVERWNARSRTVSLPRRWSTFFRYLASGPPGHRLEELLALADAGVVRFLGGDVELETDEAAGRFAASGSAAGAGRARVTARTLIDAWLPAAQAAASDNPLLRQLVRSGQAEELTVADETHAGTTGQLRVMGAGRLTGPGASRQFAVGPFTSGVFAGAFTRPGLNSLPFRIDDRLARELLREARWVAIEGARSADPERSAARAGIR